MMNDRTPIICSADYLPHYDVIANSNLNGDYISMPPLPWWGAGIAPVPTLRHHRHFEATTAPHPSMPGRISQSGVPHASAKMMLDFMAERRELFRKRVF